MKDSPEIDAATLSQAVNRAAVRYDRAGDQHYDVTSAFIKSMRGSDVDASLHYLARMIEAGEDPRFIARRVVIAAGEEVGMADPSALQVAVAAMQAVQMLGMPEARPDPRDPQGIQNVLRRVLGDLGWNAGMSAGRVLEEWDEIVGERIATHCRPVSFEDGVLVVSASSSAWASQLRMLTPQVITTIEEHVGSHVISELKVTGPAAAQRSWKKGRRTVTWRGPRDTYG